MVNQAEARRLLPKLRHQFGEREADPASYARGVRPQTPLKLLPHYILIRSWCLTSSASLTHEKCMPPRINLLPELGRGALPVTALCANRCRGERWCSRLAKFE